MSEPVDLPAPDPEPSDPVASGAAPEAGQAPDEEREPTPEVEPVDDAGHEPAREAAVDAVPEPLAAAASAVPDPDSPERRALESEASTRCLNCGHDLPGAYCPSCGQKDQPLRQPVHRFVVEAVAEYVGLDGRLWPTLATLLFRPGRLTQAYVLGRRQQYVRPLRIYITASLLFFFLLALIDPVGRVGGQPSDPMADTTMTVAAYGARVDSLLGVREGRVERQRQVLDSLVVLEAGAQEAVRADSADAGVDPDSASARLDGLEQAQDRVADAEDDLGDLLASTTTKRLRWQRDQLDRMRPDSTIRPSDLAVAAEVINSTSSGPNFNGPEWLFSGPTVQRLKNARTGAEQRAAGFALGREALSRVPTVVFVLLPVFALLLKLLYVRRGWYYSEHLVFALHVHAFTFSVFSVTAILLWVGGDAAIANSLAIALSLAIPVYFVVALKRVYAQGWIRTLVKTWLLSLLYGAVLIFGLVLALLLATATG